MWVGLVAPAQHLLDPVSLTALVLLLPLQRAVVALLKAQRGEAEPTRAARRHSAVPPSSECCRERSVGPHVEAPRVRNRHPGQFHLVEHQPRRLRDSHSTGGGDHHDAGGRDHRYAGGGGGLRHLDGSLQQRGVAPAHTSGEERREGVGTPGRG